MAAPRLVIPSIFSGETLRYKFFYKPNNVGRDWTGWNAWAQFRIFAAPKGVIALNLSVGTGGIALGSDGSIELFASAADTFAAGAGVFGSELFVRLGAGDTDAIAALQLEIKPARTVVPS
jgi:hypothetical protein